MDSATQNPREEEENRIHDFFFFMILAEDSGICREIRTIIFKATHQSSHLVNFPVEV